MRRCALALCTPLLLAAFMQSPPGQGAAPPVRPVPAVPKTLKELRDLEGKIQQTLRKIIPATVGVGGGGSGVVVSKDGLIVSVAHVTQKAGREVTITFPDGKKARARTLGNFRSADASLLKLVDKGPWPFVEMGKSTNVKPGQWCLAVGYPVSFVRGQKPPVRIGRVLRQGKSTVTSDCPIMGGDSGGPLFDLEGRVIGVNSRVSGSMLGNVHVAIDVYHTHWKRLNAAEDWGDRGGRGKQSEMPAASPVPDLKSPLMHQQRPRTPGAMERNSEVIRGAFREAVEPVGKSTVRVLLDGKPAVLGTIVSADGLIVTKASSLGGTITCKLPGGKVVAAKKIGEDREHDLALLQVEAKGLTPVKWSKAEPPAQGNLVAAAGEDGKAVAIGMVTSEPRQFRVSSKGSNAAMEAAKRAYLGISSNAEKKGGVRIDTVRPNTPAARAGLKTGDVIRKLGKEAVNSTDQLIQALRKHKPDDKVELEVRRGEKTETVAVTLGKPPAEQTRASYDRWGGGPFSERRFDFPKVLPHDTVLNPRDCGGPLVDTSGRAVGLNISRSLRISTYALLPADVEKVVKKLSAARDKSK